MTDTHEHVDFSSTSDLDSQSVPLQRSARPATAASRPPSTPASSSSSSADADSRAVDQGGDRVPSDRRLSDRRRGDRRSAQLVAGIDFEVDRRAGDRRPVHFVSAEELNERQRVRLDAIRFKALSDSIRRPRGSMKTFVRAAIIGDAIIGAVASIAIEYHIESSLLSLLLCLLAWPLTIWASRGYEERFFGDGPQEFRLVLVAAVTLLSAICVIAVIFKVDFPRSVLLTLMITAAVTLIWRYGLRQFMHSRRRRGLGMHRVLLVGHESAVAELAEALGREQYHGLHVVGACVPAGVHSTGRGVLDESLILGSFSEIQLVAEAASVDAVAVLSCPEFDGSALRSLVWQLEPLNVDLMVAPAAVEIAGPRLSVRPAAGLPLLHLDSPELSGVRRAMKELGDRLGALALVLGLSPLLLAAALAIRFDSKGPILFRQKRIGLDGEEFTMFKFRSMVPDAEARLAEIAHLNEHDDARLFKVKDDPRITRCGKFMRRYSIDELPQLFNVLIGDMSLVGPRPPLPSEVALYAEMTRNRLRVKPGLTGLWQVSGRSNLTPEESVRLDLRYVENWSPTLDLMILWKTFRAVVGKDGAY